MPRRRPRYSKKGILSFLQVLARPSMTSRAWRPFSLTVPPEILRLVTKARMSFSEALVMAALIALLDMTAKRGGPSEFDRGHDASLRRAQRRAMLRAIGVAIAAEHVRHFWARPTHRGAVSEILACGGRQGDGRRTRQQLQGAFRGADLTRGDPQIPGRGC